MLWCKIYPHWELVFWNLSFRGFPQTELKLLLFNILKYCLKTEISKNAPNKHKLTVREFGDEQKILTSLHQIQCKVRLCSLTQVWTNKALPFFRGKERVTFCSGLNFYFFLFGDESCIRWKFLFADCLMNEHDVDTANKIFDFIFLAINLFFVVLIRSEHLGEYVSLTNGYFFCRCLWKYYQVKVIIFIFILSCDL